MEERKCKLCTSGAVENDEHFVLDCEVLSHIRTKFADKVSNFTNYWAFDKTEKLRFWLAGEDSNSEIYKIGSSFISELMEERERISNEI